MTMGRGTGAGTFNVRLGALASTVVHVMLAAVSMRALGGALALLLLGSGLAQAAEDPSGRWDLRVDNDRQQAVVEATIRLTAYEGDSCMGGDWRRVEVERSRRPNPGDFPIEGPLVWRLDDGRLTIGKNDYCDDYLQLVADWADGPTVEGGFHRLGLAGAQQLGRFSLTRAAPVVAATSGRYRNRSHPPQPPDPLVVAALVIPGIAMLWVGMNAIRRRSFTVGGRNVQERTYTGARAIRIGVLVMVLGVVYLLMIFVGFNGAGLPGP